MINIDDSADFLMTNQLTPYDASQTGTVAFTSGAVVGCHA
jgi:hypothetical protein